LHKFNIHLDSRFDWLNTANCFVRATLRCLRLYGMCHVSSWCFAGGRRQRKTRTTDNDKLIKPKLKRTVDHNIMLWGVIVYLAYVNNFNHILATTDDESLVVIRYLRIARVYSLLMYHQLSLMNSQGKCSY